MYGLLFDFYSDFGCFLVLVQIPGGSAAVLRGCCEVVTAGIVHATDEL